MKKSKVEVLEVEVLEVKEAHAVVEADLSDAFRSAVNSVFNRRPLTNREKTQVYEMIVDKCNYLEVSYGSVIRACFEISEEKLNDSKPYNAFKTFVSRHYNKVAGIFVARTAAEIKRARLLEGIDKLDKAAASIKILDAAAILALIDSASETEAFKVFTALKSKPYILRHAARM